MSAEKYPVRKESVDYTIPVSGQGQLIDLNGIVLVGIEVPVANLNATKLSIMTNSQGGRNNLYAVSYLNETVQDNLSLEAAIAPNQKQVTVINATYSRGLRYFAIYMDLPQAGARTIRLILAVL